MRVVFDAHEVAENVLEYCCWSVLATGPSNTVSELQLAERSTEILLHRAVLRGTVEMFTRKS